MVLEANIHSKFYRMRNPNQVWRQSVHSKKKGKKNLSTQWVDLEWNTSLAMRWEPQCMQLTISYFVTFVQAVLPESEIGNLPKCSTPNCIGAQHTTTNRVFIASTQFLMIEICVPILPLPTSKKYSRISSKPSFNAQLTSAYITYLNNSCTWTSPCRSHKWSSAVKLLPYNPKTLRKVNQCV